MHCTSALPAFVLSLALAAAAHAEGPRARDLGIPFDGTPGPLNAITDVAGVEVGFATIIEGEGSLVVGEGPVRTGVTAILPRGREAKRGVFAAHFNMNGNGEMTGTQWIDHSGMLWGPVLITNTVSVGDVHAAAIEWMRVRGFEAHTVLPVVAETWDLGLNDMFGRHVKQKHVFAALDGARSGRLDEGNVGGGTAMRSHGFKAGTGTSSRRVGPYTVGVLVQANHGLPWRLTIAGVPVGQILNPDTTDHFGEDSRGGSSIIVVVATDAPLLPKQLERIAMRPALGIARIGGVAEAGSGEIFLAFSTANEAPERDGEIETLEVLSGDAQYTLDYLYEGVVQATEEAIVNALIAAETMVGADGTTVEAIDHERLGEILQEHGRLEDPNERAADETHAPSPLLIQDVVLIDGSGAAAQHGVDVLVRDGRIARISKARLEEADATVVDGRGRYLVPGLIDAHSHPFPVEESFPQYIHFGVTSILVTGCGTCDDQTLSHVRTASMETGAPVPRFFHTSQHFSMEGRHPAKTYGSSNWVDGKTIHFIDSIEEIEPLVERVTRQPIVGIKLTIEDGPNPPFVERMPEEFVDEIVAQAHRAGTRVFAHVSDREELQIAAGAGVDHLLHFTGVVLDWERDLAMLEDFRERDLHWVTTLMLDKSFLYPLHPEWMEDVRRTGMFDAEIERLARMGRSHEEQGALLENLYGSDEVSFEDTPILKKQFDDLRRLHEFGIRLVIGTDVGSPYIFPGYSVHEEMQLLEDAGFTPDDVLVMATRNAAEMIGVADELGTLSVGNRADMLLLDADPRETVRNLSALAAVYRDGVAVGSVEP